MGGRHCFSPHSPPPTNPPLPSVQQKRLDYVVTAALDVLLWFPPHFLRCNSRPLQKSFRKEAAEPQHSPRRAWSMRGQRRRRHRQGRQAGSQLAILDFFSPCRGKSAQSPAGAFTRPPFSRCVPLSLSLAASCSPVSAFQCDRIG